MIEIELTQPEFARACTAGMRRQAWCVKHGARHVDSYRYLEQRGTIEGIDRPAFEGNLLGAIAEMMAAKALGLEWTAEHGGPGCVDVGENVEVRRIDRPTNPLVIRSKDVDADALMASIYVDRDLPYLGRLNGTIPARAAWDMGRAPSWAISTGTADEVRVLDLALLAALNHNPYNLEEVVA